MSIASSTPAPNQPEPDKVRHVRLRMPDRMYRALRHRLADCGPETSISELAVELIETALDLSA
jgi:hypothetical protein